MCTTATLSPSDIHYTSFSLKSGLGSPLSDSSRLQRELNDICVGVAPAAARHLPRLKVTKKDGQWFALNNSHLQVSDPCTMGQKRKKNTD